MKQRKLKKSLAVLLSCVLTLSLMTGTAFGTEMTGEKMSISSTQGLNTASEGMRAAANDKFKVDNIYYEVRDENVKTVKMISPTDVSDSYKGRIEIPETVVYSGDTYTVTALDEEAFGESEKVTDIVIPDTVTNIGINAFGGCTALKSLYIPAGVTSGLGGAMTGLEGRDFTISYKAPDWPNVEITFGAGSPYSIEDGMLYNGTVAEAMLDYDATTFTIREGTTEIGDVAFNFPFQEGHYYYNLIDRRKTETVNLPSSVKVIGEMAFKGCPLKKINLENVETINDGAFTWTKITEADLSNTKTIGYQAFSGCTQLSDVTWPDDLETLGLGDPTGVGSDSTASKAFENCTSLKTVIISGPLKEIPKETFKGCSALSTVVVSENVEKIGKNAFDGALQGEDSFLIIKGTKAPVIDTQLWKTSPSTDNLTVIVPAGYEDSYIENGYALKQYVEKTDEDAVKPGISYGLVVNDKSVYIGQTVEIGTAIIPENGAEIEMTSDNMEIADVAYTGTGTDRTINVIAKKAGKAKLTFTIKMEDVTLIEQECTITVISQPSITTQHPTIETDDNAAVSLSSDGTRATITVADGYELVDVTVNGVSKGAVTELTGLKTGDKVVITTQKIETPDDDAALIEAVKNFKLVARSVNAKAPSGKKAIKVYWYAKDGSELNFDGYEIYRSTKKNSGYGTKPIYTAKKLQYFNTSAKKGTRYYYKVRGYKEIGGERIYTPYSLKAIRTAK